MRCSKSISGGTVDDEVRNPMCSQSRKMTEHCFRENRATLHLHGGISYYSRVQSYNPVGASAWATATPAPVITP